MDHIVSRKWGGVDHIFNYFVLPAALNASFNSDITDEKVVRYMGAKVARAVKGFSQFVRREAAVAVDFNAFGAELGMLL